MSQHDLDSFCVANSLLFLFHKQSQQNRGLKPQEFEKRLYFAKHMKRLCSLSSLPLASPSAGFLLFKDFCMNEIDEAVPQLKFYEEVSVPGLSSSCCA